MNEMNRFHSVRLDKNLCRGCTNCLMHCPTEAIRVRNGRAHILDERCIDCGECIRICDYHAKIAATDSLEDIKNYQYSIALPAPSLYGQFHGSLSVGSILNAVKALGFDAVYEVACGADMVSCAIANLLKNESFPKPLISSACPAVVRLIQVRFPDLIPHIVPIRQPMEVAAQAARKDFSKKHSCSPEDIGVFFITPCPAKVTAIKNPLGQSESAVNGAISINQIYGLLLPHLGHDTSAESDLHSSTSYGIGWASSSGETKSLFQENALCVDGIQNCIRVLEEIENGKLSDLTYFEGNACIGGCVGGALTYENNYVTKNTIRKVVQKARAENASKPSESVDYSLLHNINLAMDIPLQPNGALKLDDDFSAAVMKLQRVEEIKAQLPGYDCGSCGSPSCHAFAEDIVLGYAREMECIHKLKDKLKTMAEEMVDLAQTHRD